MKTGTLCYLKSGGPLMTVKDSIALKDTILVMTAWFHPDTLEFDEAEFHVEQLMLQKVDLKSV